MPRSDTLSTALGLLEYKTRIEVPPPGLYASPDGAFAALQAISAAPTADETAQLDAKCQLAVMCLQRRFKDQAMQLLQECAAGRTQLLGPRHPSTLVARELVSYTLVGQSRYAEAQAECEAVYQGRTNSLGVPHRSTLQSRFNLALLLWFQGAYADAIDKMTSTANQAQESLGDADEFAILAQQNLSYMLHLESRDAEAIEPVRRTLQLLMETTPPDDGEILKSAILASNIYRAMEWWKDHLAMYRIVAEKREVLQGRNHIATVDSLSNLASAFHMAGDNCSAEALYLETTEQLQAMYGPAHPRVMKEELRLAQMHMHQNRLDDSLTLAQDVLARCRAGEADATVGTFATEVTGATLCRLSRNDEARAVVLEGQALWDAMPDQVEVLLQSIDTANTLLSIGAVDDANSIVCRVLDRSRSIQPDEKLDEALKTAVRSLVTAGKTATLNKYYGLE